MVTKIVNFLKIFLIIQQFNTLSTINITEIQHEQISCTKLVYHGNKQRPKIEKYWRSVVMISIFNETANPPLPQE